MRNLIDYFPHHIDYTQDKDGNLVNGFTLARKASMSEANLETIIHVTGVFLQSYWTHA